MLLCFVSLGGVSGSQLLVPFHIENSRNMNNLSAVGWLWLHHAPDIWSYEHLKYREKRSARKCYILLGVL